jgi:hypothetical protein
MDKLRRRAINLLRCPAPASEAAGFQKGEPPGNTVFCFFFQRRKILLFLKKKKQKDFWSCCFVLDRSALGNEGAMRVYGEDEAIRHAQLDRERGAARFWL